MTSTGAAARDIAFEQALTTAGQELEAALASAGTDRAARDAAWDRYSNAQVTAGAAYRVAQATEAALASMAISGSPACMSYPRSKPVGTDDVTAAQDDNEAVYGR
jgi:hypothetical protein